jgi:hypothetical protein
MFTFTDHIEEAIQSGKIYNEKLLSEFVNVIEKDLNLKSLGFSLGYKDADIYGLKVGFDSEILRLNFNFSHDNNINWNQIDCYYGRKHANFEKAFMEYKGNRCICWHDISRNILKFLEGMTPIEALNFHQQPNTIEAYKKSAEYLSLGYNNPERALYKQKYIWSYYNPSLFNLFDLRDQTLWNKYYEFNEQFTSLKKLPSIPGLDIPTGDMIC